MGRDFCRRELLIKKLKEITSIDGYRLELINGMGKCPEEWYTIEMIIVDNLQSATEYIRKKYNQNLIRKDWTSSEKPEMVTHIC